MAGIAQDQHLVMVDPEFISLTPIAAIVRCFIKNR